MHTILLVTFAPLIQSVLLFLPAALVARGISRYLPEGRLKRILLLRL